MLLITTILMPAAPPDHHSTPPAKCRHPRDQAVVLLAGRACASSPPRATNYTVTSWINCPLTNVPGRMGCLVTAAVFPGTPGASWGGAQVDPPWKFRIWAEFWGHIAEFWGCLSSWRTLIPMTFGFRDPPHFTLAFCSKLA